MIRNFKKGVVLPGKEDKADYTFVYENVVFDLVEDEDLDVKTREMTEVFLLSIYIVGENQREVVKDGVMVTEDIIPEYTYVDLDDLQWGSQHRKKLLPTEFKSLAKADEFIDRYKDVIRAFVRTYYRSMRIAEMATDLASYLDGNDYIDSNWSITETIKNMRTHTTSSIKGMIKELSAIKKDVSTEDHVEEISAFH